MRLICNIIIIGILFSFEAGAQNSAEVSLPKVLENKIFKPVHFNCRIYAVVSSPTDEIEKEFKVSLKGSPHGGDPFSFQSARQQVNVTADGTWLVVEWTVDGKVLAKGMVAQSSDLVEHRALVLYNPRDDGEQVSLSCSRVED
jgi:hypothetical protein